jgi:hypothetical protein
MTQETVRIFSDAQAIQSERASDFDVYSAYGEVLDNSVQAEAKEIKIKFKTSLLKSRGKNFLHMDSVAFGDDGTGMDSTVLHRCLQLGYSSRYGNRSGIGRFGVGMTKGAISQCKKIEVYSKTEDSPNWLYTYFDIDEIASKGANINEPKISNIPDEFKELVGKKKGTLIIWSNIDKQEKTATDIIKESKIWIGRTFRKFIFEGVKFYIDGQEIKAIDPLYLHPEFTEFPNDPKALKWGDEDTFEWDIDDPDVIAETGKRKSKITIRYSLLPKEFMAKGGGRGKAGDHEDNKLRFVHKNEGISILRNNREVRDPELDIPYWGSKFKEIDRWWGCEILFDAELDNWFQVKNIKRGAAPMAELREELKERINKIKKSLNNELTKYWDSLEATKVTPVSIEIDPNHNKSTKIAKDTIVDTKPKDNFSKSKEPESEIGKFVKSRFGDLPPEKAQQFVEYFRTQVITIIESPSNSANFFEITHFGNGKSNVAYNTNHVFTSKYFQIMNDLKSNENQDEDSRKLNQQQILILIDLLLISYTMAESLFDPNANMKAADFFEDMMRNWGKSLRNLLNTWTSYE